MKKSEIEFHSDGCCRAAHPAINVKARNFARGLDIAERFKCSEETAEKAGGFAWESACERFWEDAQELCDHYLGEGKVYSEGRSGGWLVVHNLPPVESWDALRVSKWSRFARAIRSTIDGLCSAESVAEEIEVNQWAKDGAELYNFIDRRDGSTVCIADLKHATRAAGFGEVVRS